MRGRRARRAKKIGVPKPIVTRTKLDRDQLPNSTSRFRKLCSHISRLQRLQMIKQDHKPALNLNHRTRNQDRLIQDIPRQEIKLDRRRHQPNFLQRPGIVPFRHNSLIARHQSGPKLLPPPDRHRDGVARRIHAVSQGGQEGRVAGQTFRGRWDRAGGGLVSRRFRGGAREESVGDGVVACFHADGIEPGETVARKGATAWGHKKGVGEG